MVLTRWSRWAPLTGVVAALFGVAGAVIQILANSPGSDASGSQVIAFYEAHRTGEQVASILLTFAFIFLVFFAGSMRAHMRDVPGVEALSALVLAGAVIEAVGQTIGTGLNYALADVPSHLEPAAAQALNVLANDMVLTNAAGLFVFGMSSGLAILRGVQMPRWLGWVAIGIAIVVVTPAEALGFLVLTVWMVVVSLLIFTRGGPSGALPPSPVGD